MANWHELSAKDVMKALGTSLHGLSEQEAQKRLQCYGKNELVKEKGISKLSILLNQFRDILVIILIAATIISALIGQIIDALAIVIILILNAVFGFIQEYKAEKTIDALKRLASPEAIVIRDGREKKIPASLLVPGDIVVLEEGNKVPADIRLINISQLQIDESSITGESRPVSKTTSPTKTNVIAERKNMAFMGTLVTSGRGAGVVVSTGMSTEMGRIAHMVQQRKEEKTPLQKKLDRFGKNLGIIILVVCALVVVTGIFREGILAGIPPEKYPELIVKMFMTGISLAVAAIPEGLPAVVTITLAIGLRKLSSRNALMRKLPVVETLGSTTVICSDKTGTLTKNEMTVTELWYPDKTITVTGKGYTTTGEFLSSGKPLNPAKSKPLSLLLRTAVLCNNSSLSNEGQITGDPTEAALLVAAAKAGMHKPKLESLFPRIKEIPFTSKRKMMTTINKYNNKYIVSSKGATEKILSLCDKIYVNGRTRKLTKNDRERILQKSHEMAGMPLRVLAFAFKESKTPAHPEKNLTFIGLTGMSDPPREGVKHDIEMCKKAGIKVVMITGDHAATASAIAKELSILQEGDRVLTGEELDSIPDKEFASIVNKVSVYARVNPEHKLKIVDALKSQGHIIAMTGDGVNDAPALKGADIGISMGIKGTDVAKEASDMILTDDNFRSIVSAVKEGRAIYDNIKKFIQYLLSSNIGEVLIVFVAMMIGLVDPETGLILLPIQLLWINILTDALPALALGVDPPAPDIMKRKPRDPKEKILSKPMLIDIVFVGILMCVATLFLFWTTLPSGGMLAMTVAFTAIVAFEMVRVQAVRAKFRIGFFSNKKLIAAIAISLILQLAVIYIPSLNFIFKTQPLGIYEWLLIITASAAMMFVLWIKDRYFSSGMW